MWNADGMIHAQFIHTMLQKSDAYSFHLYHTYQIESFDV